MINWNALLWVAAIINFFVSGICVGRGDYGLFAGVMDLIWLWVLWGHWRRT